MTTTAQTIQIGTTVTHVGQRDAVAGTDVPMVVGTVVETGFVVNDGQPTASVRWHSGGAGTYTLDQIAKV